MSEWKEYKLGEITNWFSGGTPSKERKEFWGGNIPWISAKTMTNYKVSSSELNITESGLANGSRLAIKGDILLLVRGSGLFNDIPINIVEGSVAFNQDIKAIRAKNSKLQDFIFYWLQGNKKGLYDILEETGIGAGKFDTELLKKLEISIPSSESEFIFIIETAKTLFDKIDLLNRQNVTLEKMAETLFRQMMSEHDSLRLHDGQDEASNKSCLSNNPENRVQDNVEEETEEWKEIRITDLFEVKDGTHDSPKQKEVGKKLITSKHLSKHSIDFENAYYISEEDFEQINKRSKVDTGDILFSMIGTIGIIYLEQSKKIDYAIKNIGLFKTSQNSFWKYFTVLWLKSNLGNEFIHESRSGSTQEYISLGSLRSIIFYIPSIKKVELFNSEVEPIFKKIESNQTQIRTLTALRDTLLPNLMSGEVRVSEHD